MVYTYQAVKGSRKEAEKRLKAILRWPGSKREKVKDSSWYAYRGNVRRWLKRNIAKVPIQKLKALNIERALSSIKGKPITKKQSYQALKTDLDQAVKWKLITENPMEAVEPLNVKMEELRVWTEEETVRF